MKRVIWAILLLAAVTPSFAGDYLITPRRAIELAADAAPDGAPGVFDLVVKATGQQNDMFYLNSEQDYRDQRNLTIDIPPRVDLVLVAKYGALGPFFMGKHLHVTGVARRVKIWFLNNDGTRSQKYYYQTHVLVQDPSQIQIIPRDAS